MNVGDDCIGETDLLAYVDGHLDPERRRCVEDHLARHADDARRIAADFAIKDGIRDLFERYYQEPPPAHLHLALQREPRSRLARRLMRAAAGIVLLFGGGAGGFWIAQSDQGRRVLLRGVEHFAEGPFKPISANGERPQAPADLLGESIRGTLRVPDLSTTGLRLVGQTLVGSAERPAVQLTYENAQGGRIYLFQQARTDDVAPQMQARRSGSRGVVYWAEGPVMFAVTGDVPPDDLRIVAEAVHDPQPQRQGLMPAAAGGRR